MKRTSAGKELIKYLTKIGDVERLNRLTEQLRGQLKSDPEWAKKFVVADPDIAPLKLSPLYIEALSKVGTADYPHFPVLLDDGQTNEVILPLFDFPLIHQVFAADHVRSIAEQRNFRDNPEKWSAWADIARQAAEAFKKHGANWAKPLLDQFPQHDIIREALLELPRIGLLAPSEMDSALTAWLDRNHRIAGFHKFVGAWVSLIGAF